MADDEKLRIQYLDIKNEQYNKKMGRKDQKDANPLIPLSQGQRYGYLYSRVSTQYQADKGHSLDHQDKQLTDYCEKNNIIILEKFSDEGISGRSIERRHSLVRMLENLKPNYVVVCSNCSRLSRDTQDLLDINKRIEKANASLIILDIQLDTTTPIGRMILTLMSSLNQFEVEQTSDRVSKVMNHLSKEGKLITKPCYGYVRVNKELVEKPDEQIVIQIVKNLLKEYPDLNNNQITNILNKRGFTNRKEKPFHASTVKSIIENINNKIKKVNEKIDNIIDNELPNIKDSLESINDRLDQIPQNKIPLTNQYQQYYNPHVNHQYNPPIQNYSHYPVNHQYNSHFNPQYNTPFINQQFTQPSSNQIPFNHQLNQPFNHQLNQPSNQSFTQPSNQSFDDPAYINQYNQAYPTMYQNYNNYNGYNPYSSYAPYIYPSTENIAADNINISPSIETNDIKEIQSI